MEFCMAEKWADIPGYDGLYQVSNMGCVRSLDRAVMQNNCHGGVSIRRDRGKILTPTDNGKGYLVVGLRSGGKRKNHYVHRLVAEAFCEKKPGCFVVNHIDYNRKNNMAENLEFLSQAENVRYSSGRMKKPKSRCKKTSTGEKYITKYFSHGNLRYRLSIRGVICREFLTFEEALKYRNEVIKI